jgi:hypothetical protein
MIDRYGIVGSEALALPDRADLFRGVSEANVRPIISSKILDELRRSFNRATVPRKARGIGLEFG